MNKNNVLAEWSRATQALGAARSLAGRYNADSVSRAYYAMNHAAKAALAVDGVVADTHEGLKRMFGKHLVRTDAVEREWAAQLHVALDQRLGADYDVYKVYSEDDAVQECQRADRFVGRMRSYLLDRGLPEPEVATVERMGLVLVDVQDVGSYSQQTKPSWTDRIKRKFGLSDTPENPPKAPRSAAGAAGERGPERDGPSR